MNNVVFFLNALYLETQISVRILNCLWIKQARISFP